MNASVEWTRAAMSSSNKHSKPKTEPKTEPKTAAKVAEASSRGGGAAKRVGGGSKQGKQEQDSRTSMKDAVAQDEVPATVFCMEETDRTRTKFYPLDMIVAAKNAFPFLVEEEALALLQQVGKVQLASVTAEQVSTLVKSWVRGMLRQVSLEWPTELKLRLEGFDLSGSVIEDMEVGVRFLLKKEGWEEDVRGLCMFRSEIKELEGLVSNPEHRITLSLCQDAATELKKANPRSQRVFDLTGGPNNVLPGVHVLAYVAFHEADIPVHGAPRALLSNIPIADVMFMFDKFLSKLGWDDRVSAVKEFVLERKEPEEADAEGGGQDEEDEGESEQSGVGENEQKSESDDAEDEEFEPAAAKTVVLQIDASEDEKYVDDDEMQDAVQEDTAQPTAGWQQCLTSFQKKCTQN